MESMNLGVNRRVLLVEHEHVNTSAFTECHVYQLYTSSHCLMLLSCNFTKTRNIPVISAESDADSQWVPCYWVTLFKNSFSPFTWFWELKHKKLPPNTKLSSSFTEFRAPEFGKSGHWFGFRSGGLGHPRSYVSHFSEFILSYLQDWMVVAYHALLLPAPVSCYIHRFSHRGSFRKAMYFHYYLCKQTAMAVFWLVKEKQQSSEFLFTHMLR